MCTSGRPDQIATQSRNTRAVEAGASRERDAHGGAGVDIITRGRRLESPENTPCREPLTSNAIAQSYLAVYTEDLLLSYHPSDFRLTQLRDA